MRKVFLFLLVIIISLVVYNYSLISYGLAQAKGQLAIIWQSESIEDFVKRPDVPDSIRRKLEFVNDVRAYAVDYLGLNNSDNYTTIFNQKGKPVLWVVTGSEPYQLVPKEWHFPVLGNVPYKGFFNRDLATVEINKLDAEGYDTGVRTVGGWSTLGWFNDPILSEMLNRSWGDLSNLIIHELVHATIFVKDSVVFNENLASFIADRGAVKFMADYYGSDSPEMREYLNEVHDEKLYIDHVLKGVSDLERLYQEICHDSREVKREKKEKLIRKIMASTDTLKFKDKEYLKFLKGYMPNNTYFMSFMRYRSKQAVLDTLYQEKFNKNINAFITHLKKKHPFL